MQLKEKLNEKRVNEAVDSKVMQMKNAKSFIRRVLKIEARRGWGYLLHRNLWLQVWRDH